VHNMAVDPRLCILCRGAKYLCGKTYCPILAKSRALEIVSPIARNTEIYGSTPPSLFVGRIGYPYVYAGPSAPPVFGDTRVYDTPEMWADSSIDNVIALRGSLVIARERVEVHDIDSRIVQRLHEVLLNVKPTDVELILEKPPRIELKFDEYAPPMGPRAPLKDFRVVGSTSSSKVIEQVYYDTDLKARSAIIELYRHGVPVSHIQKLLSAGALGTKRFRKLVPTRWAITAVDAAVSEHLIERIKNYSEISEILVFVRKAHQNLFVAILFPGKWSFEWMEAWFPRSTWNPFGAEPVIEGDYELLSGRSEYPSIGGCYYASRLAVAEYLDRIGKQATVTIFREIYEGFDLPVGVWFVRENLRKAFESRPIKASSIDEVAKIVDSVSRLGFRIWFSKSRILKLVSTQRRIDDFMRNRKN